MTDLKAKTIESILLEDQFDMANFGSVQNLTQPHCGTACCIAGHIVHAASQLGMELPFAYKGPEGYIEFDQPAYKAFSIAENLEYDYHPTAKTARVLWAKVYGVTEANRLEFDEGWTSDLQEVTPEQAVAHLSGATPDEAQGVV